MAYEIAIVFMLYTVSDPALTCAVGLVRPVSAVVVSVAAPRLADTNTSSTCELSRAALVSVWEMQQHYR